MSKQRVPLEMKQRHQETFRLSDKELSVVNQVHAHLHKGKHTFFSRSEMYKNIVMDEIYKEWEALEEMRKEATEKVALEAPVAPPILVFADPLPPVAQIAVKRAQNAAKNAVKKVAPKRPAQKAKPKTVAAVNTKKRRRAA